jgi:putative membrane-bound dehydrogenase-like protein
MKRIAFLLFIVGLLSISHAQDKPIPPKDAPKAMKLPEGFQATLFAGEPDVVQPIAFTFDDRGRLWVVESFSYPKWTKEKEGKDRILILEDTDGDGVHDKRTVFWDKGANLSGIEIGFGGVWLCATPNLLFLPFKEGEDKPSGPPEILLDGWSLQAKHNVFNALAWGPDGWLYGCNGILATSNIGKPGTPDNQRTPMNCGVWRYHPTKKNFEVVANGTTNPWGLDFDDHGEMFITNCVIKHLFHVVPGAHYERMYGQDFNPHLYGLMESGADHIHWGGGDWTTSRSGKGSHSDAGGGHAHSGCCVYLGDNFPDKYRNQVFTCNIHGNRVNVDRLERNGSTYVAKHEPDFLFANDEWFRGLGVKYGPDGGLFVSDWTDTGECHNYEVADQTNGRIYKVTYGKPTPWKTNLQELSDGELLKLQWHKNDWLVRHARRILQERALNGKKDKEVIQTLFQTIRGKESVAKQLKALWCLFALGEVNETTFELQSLDSEVRAWVVRLLLDEKNPSKSLIKKLAEIASQEKSPQVQLAIASGLQKLSLEDRWLIAEKLVQVEEATKDPYLPLMIWYGIESLPTVDLSRSIQLIEKSKIPLIRNYLARRIASLQGKTIDHLNALVNWLNSQGDNRRAQRDIIAGMYEALKGQRKLQLPEKWLELYPRLQSCGITEVQQQSMQITAQFGDPNALEALRRTSLNERAEPSTRESAIRALLSVEDGESLKILNALFTNEDTRGVAIRGFAQLKDASIPELLLKSFSKFSANEKSDALHTLASRPSYALALLGGIEKGLIARNEVSVFVARQMLSLGDKQIQERLPKVWGQIRSAKADRVALTQKYRNLLSEKYLQPANLTNGRVVFANQCASCHKLYDAGGDIGPALTGSQRANLDYILENVLDPSAVVAREYQMQLIGLTNGRFLNAIVKQETEKALTVQTQNEVLIIPKEDIDSRKTSPVSMMPDGIFEKLKEEEIRDLIAYLKTKEQVPLPTEKK